MPRGLSGSASAPTLFPKLDESEREEINPDKERDFGYGVPRWSPYWTPKKYEPIRVKPVSSSYGEFPESHISQQQQLKQNVENIREMKGWAKVDHTWELVGARPKWADDLKFIENCHSTSSLKRRVPLSEEKKRDYGYGVPLWSPYYRSSKN